MYSPALISMSDASFGFSSGPPILEGVALEVMRGDLIVVNGSSASGKTTLAKSIAGFLPPSSGSVKRRCRVNLLLNKGIGLRPALSLFDNAMIRCLNFNPGTPSPKCKVQEVLRFAGLEAVGGQALSSLPSLLRSRFALCLYKLHQYELLVVDENLGLNDKNFRSELKDLIRYLIDNSEAILVFSRGKTHFDDFANKRYTLEGGRLNPV